MSAPAPHMTETFVDPSTGVRGYLVIDSLVDGVAAGGLRLRAGVSLAELTELARNMTRKQAVAGLRVGGAKAGLDLAPDDPRRRAALRWFLEAMRPLILSCYSVGPDLNTTMAELEALAREVEIPALKIAIGRSRGLSDEEFLRRYALFEARIDGFTVNQLRAPAAVEAATLALLDELAVTGGRIAIAGAGNMGGAAAWLLARAGARIVAWADDEKCLVDAAGLPVEALIAGRRDGRLPPAAGQRASRDVLAAECDVLILAAVSRAFGPEEIPSLRCRGVVEAANLALDEAVEVALHDAGVLVVPDVIASVGGSVAVEALYAASPTSGADVLAHVRRRIDALTRRALLISRERRVCPRAAATASKAP